MPELARPDGGRIHWEQHGDGPLVVMVLQFFGLPDVFEDLIVELSTDHRVVTYDVRGTGGSSKEGPYDFDTDSDDLAALISELGPPAVLITVADGMNRAVRVGVRHPELVTAVVAPGGSPVARQASRGTEALAGSDTVVEAMRGMIETDYRSALRSIISTANPEVGDDGVRDRVQAIAEYCSAEVAATRFSSWIDDELAESGAELGARLWILEHGTNPWFPSTIIEKTRELLPEAHVEQIEDGPISRPDITSSFVRRITAGQRSHASRTQA